MTIIRAVCRSRHTASKAKMAVQPQTRQRRTVEQINPAKRIDGLRQVDAGPDGRLRHLKGSLNAASVRAGKGASRQLK
jgi:hypothetical protein